jgi:DNA-binding Lrp family transcriptional regulator
VREILELLEKDSTLSHDTLATMTGRSVAEVTAQVEAWEKAGVIRRYKAVVDWEKVDRADGRDSGEVTAFIDVAVTPARGVGFDDVAERIARFDEVLSCYLVSGGHDLRCTVVGPNIRAVSDFVSRKLSTIDRVQATATHFVLKTHKRDGDSFSDPEPDHRLPVTP